MISCVGPRPQTFGLYTVTMLIKSSLQIQMRGRVKLIPSTFSLIHLAASAVDSFGCTAPDWADGFKICS